MSAVLAFPTHRQRLHRYRTAQSAGYYAAFAARVRGALYSIGIAGPDQAQWIAEHAGIDRRTAGRLLDGKRVQTYTGYLVIRCVATSTGLTGTWLLAGPTA